jgi:simple sugar transport system ATP-binding protein
MTLLTLDAISRSFGAIQALSGVNLSIGPGEVVGLMGDNGAGKSTLAKLVAGNFPPSTGRMLFDGQEVAFARRATALFRELKSETRAGDLVRQMSGGQRQAVAIARTRLSDARLIIMDEPTAAISVRQIAEVLALIGRLREAGIAVILISHRMPDVFETCDRVVVMRRGRKVADKSIAASSPQEVTGLITGALEVA